MKLPTRLPAVRAGTLLAIVLPVLILGAGLSGAVRARTAELTSGSAWLLSDEGQVILVSGPAARRVFATRVSEPDSRLALVQTAEAAYVLTSAAALRLDTATLRINARFDVPNPGPAARIFAGTDRIYVLDGAGIVYTLDPRTLQERAPVRSLDVQLGEATAVVDAGNRLWTVDADTGSLRWVDDAGAGSGSAGPGAELVVTGGEAVVIGGGTASWLNSSGQPTSTLDLGLLGGEQPVVAGTSDGRLLVAIAARKLVKICDKSSCSIAQLPDAGAQLGVPAALENVVLVPDFTSGSVHLIRPGGGQFANPRVLDTGAPFEMLVHEGYVFYNDVGSERAGVLRINDDDTSTTTAVEKYKVLDPNEGLDSAVSETTSSESSSLTPTSSEAVASPVLTTQPTTPRVSTTPRTTTSASVRTTSVPPVTSSQQATVTPAPPATTSTHPSTTATPPTTTPPTTSPPVTTSTPPIPTTTTTTLPTTPTVTLPTFDPGTFIFTRPFPTLVPFPTLLEPIPR